MDQVADDQDQRGNVDTRRFNYSEPNINESDEPQSNIISFRTILILSSLACLKFHQLSLPGRSTHHQTVSLGITTDPTSQSVTIISLTINQLELQPIQSLIKLITYQLQNSRPTTLEPQGLVIDFSCSSEDYQGTITKSNDKSRLAQFHLVLQVLDHQHLKLTSQPGQKLHPKLTNWFLLHTVNLIDQISKSFTKPNTDDSLEAHSSRLCSFLSKLSEEERQIILELSRPTLTATEINASRPTFVQHFLNSKSLVELVLRSAQINENLVALHWFERAEASTIKHDQEFNMEFKLTFKQFAHYSYLISEHLIRSLPEIYEQGEENPTICLLMSKNPWLVLIMFAVSLTGSSYLNLELSTPKNRIKTILKNSKVALLLTYQTYDNHQFNFNQNIQLPKNTQTLKEQLEFENIIDLSTYCEDLQDRFKLVSKESTKNDDQTSDRRVKGPLELLDLYESRIREKQHRKPMARGRDDIAYIVYTSGTTGEPKPIKISNSNLLHFLFNYSLRFQRKNDGLTRVLQFASYAFDVSVMSIWDTLAHGATICMTTEENLKTDLIGTMISLRCTTVDLTPTVLNILIEDELFRSTENLARERVSEIWAGRGFYLNHLNTGAEPVSADLRRKFLSRGVSVCVDYGPSETTVGVISSLTLEDRPGLPLDDIGRPTGLNEIYILEPHQDELVPLGGVGEICVGGGQVAAGYADNGLSLGKFVEVKLDRSEPTRLYRTGDLGKFLPNGSERYGSICCLGRIDSQVKISGVRVELGEVEKRFNELANQLPSLCGHRLRTVISKWGGHTTRTVGLVCFVEINPQLWELLRQQGISLTQPLVGPEPQTLSLSEEGGMWFDGLVQEIKLAVRDDLSSAMIPRYWIAINRIPVNYAGKVDRRVLNSLLEKYFCDSLQELPPAAALGVGPIERFRQIASEAWSVGLGRQSSTSRFKDTDNFVKLGGDSIGMMRTIGMIRKNKIGVHFSTLARADNFLAFVHILQQHKQETSSIEPRANTPFALLKLLEKETILDHLAQIHSIAAEEIEDCYPTSPTQAGIISASLEDEYTHDSEKVGIYFSQAVYDIHPNFSSESIASNMRKLVSNHSSLRTIFVWPDSLPDPSQVVLNDSSPRSPKNVDILRLETEEDYRSKLNAYLKEDRDQRKFEWGRLSVSMRIFECEDSNQRRLVWSLHHALSDGWTLEILMKELGELCRREKYESSSIHVSPSRTKYSEFVEAWKKRSMVHQRDIHQFWKSYLDGVQRNSTGSAFMTTQRNSTTWLGRQKLEELKLSHGITPAIAIRLCIAIGLFNAGLAGPDVVFGMVRSGREVELDGDRLAEEVVGCCVSILPVRTKLWDARFREMSLLEALENERNVEAEIGKHQMISIGELGRLVVGHGQWLDTLVTIQSWGSTDHSERPIKQPPELIRMPTRFKLSIEVTLEEDRDAITIDLFYDNRSFDDKRLGASADSMADGLLAHLVSSFNHLSDSHHHQSIQSILNPSLSTERLLSSTQTQSVLITNDYNDRKLQLDEETNQPIDHNHISQDQEARKIAKMKEIWMEILGLSSCNPMGLNRSFENLGGDSISMMRLIKRIKDEFYQEADHPKCTGTTPRASPCCIQVGKQEQVEDDSHMSATQIKIRNLFREIKNGIKFIDLVHLI